MKHLIAILALAVTLPAPVPPGLWVRAPWLTWAFLIILTMGGFIAPVKRPRLEEQ